MFDYEKAIYDYLERDEPTDPQNRHIALIKSAGLAQGHTIQHMMDLGRELNLMILQRNRYPKE